MLSFLNSDYTFITETKHSDHKNEPKPHVKFTKHVYKTELKLNVTGPSLSDWFKNSNTM